jgi:transposase
LVARLLLLNRMVTALERHVIAADNLHWDDTPVPILVLGNWRTETALRGVYVPDERPIAGQAPPAV